MPNSRRCRPRRRTWTAAIGTGRVTLTWDAVANAASYELWAWDSINRAWGRIGGALTGTSYAHPVLMDGRNYYYQVRACERRRHARRLVGTGLRVPVVTQQFPPPPPSLGVNLLLLSEVRQRRRHRRARPLGEYPTVRWLRRRAIITGMLSGRADLLAHPRRPRNPGLYRPQPLPRHRLQPMTTGWEAYMPESGPDPALRHLHPRVWAPDPLRT